jgi:hypothetical protein
MPLSVCRSSGSSVRLPAKLTLASVADALEQLADRLDAARVAARTDPAWTEPHHEMVELPARQAADGA